MDWEEIPKRRKKMVGIRRMACQSGSTEVNYLPTHSQYLFDSTLREDVTQFDFTTSLVLSEGVTLPHSDVTASLEVTLESDSLNEHECMSTLCGLIQHMVQCGISPLPQENEQPTSLPGWMDMLKKSLEDEYKHKNAKVFILKLIVNCETVFKPYAKFWLSPIMKAILDRCAGTDLNYFLTDIIAMLLSWYDVAIPQSSDVFASEILHFLIANIHHNRRDIFKHNLEVIKTLVEVWKPCLSIPKQQLLDGIVPKGGPDSRDTETGIQLVGVMLANDIHPWSETGKKLFLDKLLSNMDSNQREVYLPCAEVIGMSLKLLGTNLNIAQPLESDSSFLENVNSKLNKIKIHNKLDKFIFCLHGIYKHFSTIVDNFMPVILFHIKKMAGMFRVLSLEMIHSRLVTIQQSLYLTLVDVGLMEYLTNRESDVQELALKIVSQAAPRIEPTQLALIFPEVCRFGSHGVLACRRVMYEIAMWVYTEFRQRIDESDVEMSLFEESKVILLRGLVDSDSALQETVFKFWNTDAHFPVGTAHRLITLLTELYSPRTEPNFLAYSTQLLLEATALGPDFSRKIFDHPLSACKFEDLKVLVSWRAQHTSIAPMFAETFVSQPNTQAPGSLDMVVRATQTSLEFQPTLDQGEDVVDASNTSFSSLASSSLLFTVGSLGDKSRRARRGDQQLDNSAEVVNSNPSSSYLRRRFLKDKEKIRIGFASREILRKHRREEHLKERAKKREATVNMYRSYRIGDLPDIEILHSALIQPLRVLAKRDSSIGRRLLVSLFSGILVEMGDGADWFTARSSGALGDILSSSTLSCPPVIGTVLEIALANSQHINLDIESITTASRSSGLLTLGSLLLEQMLMKGADEGQRPPKRARVRTDTGQQLWLKLAELYGHLDEWDVVRGIFRDKVQCGDSVEEALLAEATGFWREARDLYQETLQDPECLVHDYCYQALYKCLAHLSDWDRLNTNVKSQAADGDLDQLWKDSWCQEQVLPWLFSSEIQLKLSQVDPTGETVASWPFLATVQKWLDDEDKAQHLRYNYSYMLALIYTLKRDFELANHHAAQDLTLFLETWCHLSPLEDKLRTASMLDLQRSADMHVYLEFAGATNNARYQQNVTTIVDRWSHTLPCTADSLLHWDKRVMTRCGFIAQMKGRLIPMGQQSELLVQRIKNLQTEMELSLIDTALAQSNFYVARKFLERTKSKVGGGDMEQSVRWGLYFSRAKWLRAQLEDEPANQLKWTLAAWMQLDDLLESKVAQNDCTLHISIQQHQSVLAQGARHHISAAPHILADIDPVSLDGLTRRVSADSHSPEALIEGLKEFGLSCLLKATQLVKTDSLPGHQTTLVAETYLLLAQYCRSLVERDDGNQSVLYDTHIVTSILRAMKHGSRQARQLFPCLLQISSIANITKETFQKESSDVPEWMFLGWVSQLIASLDTPVGLALGDLILRLATSYPKAVIYPFYISSDKYKFKDGESSHHTRCLIDRLKGVLQTSSLQDTLLKAFSCVAQPPLILKYHLDILIKFLEDEVLSLNKLRSSFHDMMAEVFSSNTSGETKLHGSVFKTVMSFKDTLLKILGENCDKVNGTNLRPAIQALKEEKAKVSAVMDSYSKKIPKLLKDFCPWLEEFQGAKFSEELEIPGQYTGEQRPLPQFHVKILGFGSQVLVMKSLRYPLRLTILGNDAKEHHYLVKFGEDLRQDQRIQQLLRLMNEILHNDAACHRHSLNICTYQVVPLTSKVGIIEWVNETKPLRQFFTDHLNQEEEMMNAGSEKINKEDVPGLRKVTYEKVSRVSKAISSFAKPGIYPFSDAIFDEEDFLPASLSQCQGLKGPKYNASKLSACNYPLSFNYSSPMASLVLTDSFKKLPDQIMYPYAELNNLQKPSRNKSKDVQAKERYATAYLKFNRDETVTKFQELTNRLPWDIFRRGLSALSSSPEVFFSLRHNFMLSYATMCISHWFLGIGDRHLSNCLVSQKDARCVAIDFGHSFGTATQFLPVPELFPFRLTPHLVSMMQPIGQTGFLRESMIHVVRALRKNHSILLATMEVFVLEPSIDWLELARKQNKNIHASTSFRKVDEDSWFPRQKISLARKKFEGANPAAITMEELQTGIMSSSVALKKILEVARGDAEHNIRAKLPDTSLTPEKQRFSLMSDHLEHGRNIVKEFPVSFCLELNLRIFESVCHQPPQFVSPGTNLLDSISDLFLGDILLDFPENVSIGFAFISTDHHCSVFPKFVCVLRLRRVIALFFFLLLLFFAFFVSAETGVRSFRLSLLLIDIIDFGVRAILRVAISESFLFNDGEV
uniref:DNA-dependent protein kinase catalytic subunit n=1 Tax=Timema poppense TaxID=170557 RepID=A0A7R9GV62_TIMPO|nr:unnamed protein product [Timema poppensis]